MRKQAFLLGVYVVLGFLVSIPLTGSSCESNNDAQKQAEQQALIDQMAVQREKANADLQTQTRIITGHFY